VVVIAGGLGCFEPRKPPIEGIEAFEGRGVDYFVKQPEKYRDRRVIIAGGGDSALDWTIELSRLGAKVILVHRRSSFRGAPDSVEKVMHLVQSGQVRLMTEAEVTGLDGEGRLDAVIIRQGEEDVRVKAEYFIPLFGLTPKLGPIADWGLNLDKNAIVVDPMDCSTNVPGIFAIGDINTYPGKLKLILCGFHEATMMCQGAFRYVYPDQKLSFKYTTVTGIEGF
jgi:thioredoxin reductase (NADPH)